MQNRTKVYDSIVDWLADHRWHETRCLVRLTRFPEQWLAEIERDPAFEVDGGKVRLRTDSRLAAS